MFKNILCLALVGFVTSACVKFEIKPGSVVEDTVEAGKDLYHTLKRKRSGEEERVYTHSLPSLSEEDDTANIGKCKAQLKANIEQSSEKLSKVLSESSGLEGSGESRKMTCEMKVLVIPAE